MHCKVIPDFVQSNSRPKLCTRRIFFYLRNTGSQTEWTVIFPFNPEANTKFKGSLTRDFRLQVFFMNQCPPGPWVFHWGLFDPFEDSQYSRMNVCDKLFIGVVDTGDKFIAGVIVTGEKLSSVTTAPAINLSPVSLSCCVRFLWMRHL